MHDAKTSTYRGPFTSENLARLRFREHPFLPTADPRFLFLSGQHTAVLDRIQDLVNLHEGLGVVEGPIGVGKTLVARRLHSMFDLEPGYRPVFIHTAAYNTPTEAARDIARAFGRPTRRAQIDQLRDFESFLVELRKQDVNAVVIIDDAQKMSPASLDAIQNFLNFEVRGRLIQIVLFAQPEIHGTFAANGAVLSRVVSWQRLSPLPADDAAAMLQFRCTVAGRQEALFTEGAFLKIYEAAEGVPRPMITISAEVLRLLVENNTFTAGVEHADLAIAAYAERSEASS
ncbi:MAG: ATP-binding protein [Chloroflexota bacterium]